MKVSAIVSAYYAEPYIKGRLENLLMQKPMPEIVVIAQRGSFEEEVVQEYDVDFASHSVFNIIRTDDIPTIYEAWNMGIKAAKGEYVTNSNCDDRLNIGALRRMSNALDNHSMDVVFANVRIEYENGTGNDWKRVPDETGAWQNPIDTLIERCVLGPMPMWRKSLHDDVGYFDEQYKHAGDYEMWLRFAFGGAEFYYIDEVLGTYLKRPDSDEHKFKHQSIMETQMAQGDYKERLENE